MRETQRDRLINAMPIGKSLTFLECRDLPHQLPGGNVQSLLSKATIKGLLIKSYRLSSNMGRQPLWTNPKTRRKDA